MKFGIGIPNCREGRDYPAGFAGPEDIVRLCQLAESLGFDSTWADDHITPDEALRTRDSQPPSFYEPFLTLAYVASVTRTIRLGVGVLVIIWREPVLVAKQVATLDVFSGGRVILGVGLGGSREEFEAVNPRWRKAHRGRILDEDLEILDLLFTRDDVSYKGHYYEFQGLTFHPKPVQNPLPIYITGTSEEVLRRIARWGSGCFVLPREEGVRQRLDALRPLMEERGRDLSEIDITTSTTISIARTHQEAVEYLEKSRVSARLRDQIVGTPSEMAEKIKRLEDAGLTHFTLQRFAASTFQELTEQVQMFGEEVLPLFKKGH